MNRYLSFAFAALLAVGCGKSNPAADAGFADAGSTLDAGLDAGAGGLTCGQLLRCDQACSGPSSCTDGCYAKSTAVAQGLFDTFTGCIAANCPSTDGGPCADSSSSACSNCNTSAATGPCIGNLEGCEQDTVVGPPNGDAGAVVPDAGPVYNCGQLLACVNACAEGDTACVTGCDAAATAEAVSLKAVLDSCLAIACPSTDGGPCAQPGVDCNGCIAQVTLAQPDTCATPYIACNADTSNGDGGRTPTVLVDGGTLGTILTGLHQDASSLIAFQGSLYFADVEDNSQVVRLRLDGGADAGLEHIGPPLNTPVGLAVDANNIYAWTAGTFSQSSNINNKDGTVVQIPRDGGAAITLMNDTELLYDAPYLQSVAVDARSVYWVYGAQGNDGAIMKAPIGGGTPVALFSGQQIPEAVTTDGTNIYWTDLGTYDSQGRANNDGTVWQGSVDGGAPIKLASGQPAPYGITFDDKYVYWVDTGPLGGDNLPALNAGSVNRVPIGGGPVTTIASAQAAPLSIIVRGGTLYWNEYGVNEPGLIMSAPTDGGIVVPLVGGLNDPACVTMDGETLYWSNDISSPDQGFLMSYGPVP